MLERVLMVCVGNVCRSPLAEALARSRLSDRPGARVESAGIAALVGKPADPLAQDLAVSHGLDLSRHRARQLTPEMVREFDLVLAMDEEQVRAVEAENPSMRGRVHRIGEFGGFDVPDPYRKGPEAFATAFELIERGVNDFQRRFWSN